MIRKGTTLIEVLIAIFIMALGLVALLTLFPLGAAQMARSIQDERAAQLAANSASYFRMYWKSLCEGMMPQTAGGQMMYSMQASSLTDPRLGWFTTAMDDPNAGVPNRFQKNIPMGASMTLPTNLNVQNFNLANQSINVRDSYPVMIDPIGFEAGIGTSSRFWVAPIAPSGMSYSIPRRTMVGMEGNRPAVMRTFLLLDDMGFDADGTGVAIERSGQYSCSWLLKREQNAKRSDVSLTVVVYFRRSTETASDEPAFVGSGNGTVLTIAYNNGEKPGVRKGGWILDSTMESIPNTTDPNRFVDCHARYYRVADILEDNGSTIQVQLERDLKPLYNPGTPSNPAPRLIVIQDRVLEVFEKGALDMGSPSRPN